MKHLFLPFALITVSASCAVGPAEAPAFADDPAYERGVMVFCVDLMSTAVSLVPGTRLGPGRPEAGWQAEFYAAAMPVCEHLVAGRAAEVMAFYSRDPGLDVAFNGGFASFQANAILPTDYGALAHDFLQDTARIDLEPLRRAVYGDAAMSCQETPDGAVGQVYAGSALLEGLLTLRRGAMWGEQVQLPLERRNGCIGSGVGTFGCGATGMELSIEACEHGCADGRCRPGPVAAEAEALAPVTSGTLAIDSAGCAAAPACPAAGSLFEDLVLPTCDGSLQPVSTVTCGAAGSVLYFYDAWCPICLQHARVIAEQAAALQERGIRVAFVVGLDQSFNPATAATCRNVAAEFPDEVTVFYDPTGQFLDRIEAGAGGGAFAVVDGQGAARFIATAGGALADMDATLETILQESCQ